MNFLTNASFLAFNTLLGLTVNVLTLVAFIFGIIELKPGFGPLSKPGTVITLLYLFMVICWVLVGQLCLRKIKQHRKVGKSKLLPAMSSIGGSFALSLYTVTVPTTALWILASGEIAAWSQSFAVVIVPLSFVTLFLGGLLAAAIVLNFDWLLNPDDYTHHPLY